ncbi:hypothetical protein JCM15124A_13730 [Prevotella falsenii]
MQIHYKLYNAMRIKKLAGFIPWVFVGSLIGSVFVVPMIPKIVDALYYMDKYNNDAAKYYQKYVEDSYDIRVVMPEADSKLFLHNVDREKYPLCEVFDTTYHSSNYFNNPSADYTSFYCKEYKKYLNIISFKDVDGSYGSKIVALTVNRDEMNNPEYGTMDNSVPVLKAIGVSEPIWFDGRDTNSIFIDKFYRNNVIQYLKYKMSKKEFERRFKNKGL